MNTTLRFKFNIIFIITILIPVLTLGSWFAFIYKTKLEERHLDEQKIVLQSLKSEVLDKHLMDMETVLTAISQNPDIPLIFTDPEIRKIVKGQWELCREIFPERVWIYYGSNENEILTVPSWEAPPIYNLLERPWFLTGKESDVIKWTEPYIEYVNNDVVISATLGIKDQNNNFSGVISIDTTAKEFLKLFKNEAINKKTKLLIMSKNSVPFILNEEENTALISYDWSNYFKQKSSPIIDIDNVGYYIQYIDISPLKMSLVSLLPTETVSKEIFPVLLIIYLMLSIGIILALAAGMYMSKNIISKIITMNDHIKEAVNGDYSKQIKSKSSDEFDTLFNNINTLVNTVDVSLQKKEKLIEFRNSLIHLLSHNSASPITYLYNITFDLLKSDSENIDYKMIFTASRTLKSLNENIMTFITIDEGFENGNIETIDLLSLSNMIKRNYELQADAKNIKIIINSGKNKSISNNYFLVKMILGNLIDNAVKYSFSDTNIIIDISSDDTEIFWKITDEGPGFNKIDKSLIYGRFQTLSAKPTGGEPSVGLGLYLVKQLADSLGIVLVLNEDTGSKGAQFTLKFNL